MPAQVLPMTAKARLKEANRWREEFLLFLNGCLDELEKSKSMDKLWDITGSILENKSDILGQLALGLVKRRYPELFVSFRQA